MPDPFRSLIAERAGIQEPQPARSRTGLHFVYPGSAGSPTPVTYQYCVNIQGASPVLQCSLPADAAFNVTGPGNAQMTTNAYGYLNVDMLIDKSPCLTSADSDPYLQYGNISGYESPCPVNLTGDPVGIKFTQPDAPASGTYSFVQILTTSIVNYVSGESSGDYITTPGLDSQYPYPRVNPSDEYVSDSPDVVLVDGSTIYSEVSRTFSANMYLLWTSSNTGSIPVPIGSQSWHFKTSTTNSGYPSGQNWSQPSTDYVGTDGDPVDYVTTMPSVSPYGYPTWKGLATPVWSTTNANEVEQEDGQ